MGLAPEKLLLKWMNFHLKKAGYKKTVANFSSDLKVYIFFVFPLSSQYQLVKKFPLKEFLICLPCQNKIEVP